MAATSTPIPLPLSSEPGLSKLASDERLVNCYPETAGSGPNERVVLYGSHGLTAWSNGVLTGECRGLLNLDDATLLAVQGSTLYTYDTAGAVTNIGTVSGTDPVIMARNAAGTPDVAIVCAAGVYIYKGGALSLLSDPDLPAGSVGVIWIDGYLIFALADGRFFWSGINATTISALDFATAEANPDGLVAVAKLNREIYFLGSQTVEVWTNTGAATQPFERLPGAVIEEGCASKHTVVNMNGALFWLNTDNQVVRTAGGYQVETVSNRGVYEAVRAVADKTEIRAFHYTIAQHSYYVLTHSTFTWVFDATLGRWYERKSKNNPCWRIVAAELFDNQILMGSRLEATIWAVDEDAFAEGTDEIEMIARFPRLDVHPNGATVDQIDLDFETGVGDAGGAYSDTITPVGLLYWSDDGGKTLKGGRTFQLGPQGEYTRRVRLTRLGSYGPKGRLFEVRVTSRVFRALIGASVRIEPRDLGG